MGKVSARLAALGAVSVLVTMLVAALAFGAFMGWRVERDAVGTVERTLAWDDQSDITGAFEESDVSDMSDDFVDLDDAQTEWSYDDYEGYASYFVLDASFSVLSDGWWVPSAQERGIAAWFAEHREQDVVRRVSGGGWTCYAAMTSISDGDPSVGAAYLVAYCDVTDELSFIASIHVAFAIIALVCATVAALAGRAAGLRVERAQAAQRRLYENVSHELKTPLAAIRGYAEGACAGVVDGGDALVAIDREADRMASLVGDILDLSRLESGSVAPRLEEAELADLVQDCLMPFEGAIRSRAIDVTLDLAQGTIAVDPALFDHALSNLLSNAVRHAGSWVCVRYDGSELSVANDGDAPAEHDLPHLFERFYTGEGGSTGIGLAIAAEIASLHGWEHGARLEDGHLVVWLGIGEG